MSSSLPGPEAAPSGAASGRPRTASSRPSGFGLVPILVFFLPVIELILLVWGTVEFGLWVGLYVLVAVVLGITIARLAGHGAFEELRTAMAERREPQGATLSRKSLAVVAGILIAIPGPVTDVAGLVMLLPGVRPWIGRQFSRWAQKKADASGMTGVRMRTTQRHTVVEGSVEPDAGTDQGTQEDRGSEDGDPTIIRGEVED